MFRIFKKVLLVFFAAHCLTIGSASAQQLPALGGVSSGAVSSIEEQRLGRQFMRSARRQMDFSKDPEVSAYIEELGSELVQSIGLSPDHFTFSVVNDSELNAFAVPGGFISVHSGLIIRTGSESELASVMAHETAHLTQRHLPRMIERAKERSLPAAAAMVAAILLGGQVGSAALISANAALAADQLKYSRDFEKEADAVGIQILASSGFEPSAMPSFFQKLEKNTTLQASEVPEYLRTHPLSVSRIAESETRASHYPSAGRESSDAYHFVKARVRALTSSNPQQAADYFHDLAGLEGIEAISAFYGEGLALQLTGQYAKALKIFDDLTKRYPDNLFFQLALGQVSMRSGQAAQALAVFEPLYEQAPMDNLRSNYLVEALIAAGKYDEARKIIRKWQRRDPGNPEVYRFLSRVEGELGHQTESFQARAEFYALRFELRQALEELSNARRYSTGNFYLTSSIDARVKELQDDMRRYKEDGTER